MVKKLQLKIMLRDSKPPIWRRIIIKDNITFQSLHDIIQDSMGWDNYHLYEFDLGTFSIGIPYEDSFEEIIDSRIAKVNKYFNQKGAKLNYNYDFGDSWQHRIIVEKVEPIKKDEKYPVCIKGKGNCPPEDCGGIWGFYELLDTIKDKKHPDHESMLEWLGGEYDPENFEIDSINKRLVKFQG